MGLASGAAMALGPTLGGLIAAGAGWRWIFLLNLPVCLLSAPLIPRMVAASRDPEGRALDGPGIALLTLALLLVVQAILHDAAGAAWRLAQGVLGVALLVVFGWQQRRRARPVLDPALLARREAAGIAGVLLALSVGYWAVLVYLPSFLQAGLGLGTEASGTAMLAATLPMLIMPPLGVRLLRRVGPHRAFGLGLGVLGAGLVLVALLAAHSAPGGVWWTLAGLSVAGIGAGLINTQVSGALIALAPASQAGMAAGLATLLRQGGFAIGIALLGVVAGSGEKAGSFVGLFTIAALVAGIGSLVAVLLGRAKIATDEL